VRRRRTWPWPGCWHRATISFLGTKRVSRVEENLAAYGIEHSAEQIDKLNNLTPAVGAHHNEEQMRLPDR
jgi:diketogulonate reductase-like aldo/keto reductase